MADIFISYAREHKNLAEELAKALIDHRYDVWWDEYLSAGQPFDRAILEQIAKAEALVVIWSPEAAGSQFVLMEVGIAYAWNKKLIPTKIPGFPDSALPRPFDKLQAIELTDTTAVVNAVKAQVNPPNLLEQSLRKLDKAASGLREDLQEWVAKLPGFYLQGYDKSFSISVRSPVGPHSTDVNFGTIDTRDATFSAGNFCTQNIVRDNSEAARRYTTGLAAIVATAYVTANDLGQPTDVRMPGSAYPPLRALLDRGDEWARLMLEAKQALSEAESARAAQGA